ncbi:11578_t:CDS:2, partial [Cetraspora pellucida]
KVIVLGDQILQGLLLSRGAVGEYHADIIGVHDSLSIPYSLKQAWDW